MKDTQQSQPKGGQKGLGKVLNQMPLMYFLVALGLVYTFNALRMEDKKRDLIALKSEVKEMRWRAMSAKAEFMKESVKSQVKRKVEGEGLKEDNEKVFVIKSSEK